MCKICDPGENQKLKYKNEKGLHFWNLQISFIFCKFWAED